MPKPRHRATSDHSVDRATFQRLYEETAVSLRAYLRLSCRDNALADDVLQDTYLRLLRRGWPELDAHQRKSYLYKTAHSALVDHYRARQRETRWRAEQPTIGDPNARRLCVGLEDGSPDALLELPDDMRRVFDTLTARQRSLLWLAYVEGFKHDEIAAVLGVTASSVRVLLSRARAELAAKLSSQSLAPIAARGVER